MPTPTPFAVIFIGPQGCGKGTQLELLKHHLEQQKSVPVTHIQTGKPFRELAATGGYTAAIVKDLIDNGRFVPNVLTSALVVNELVHNHVAGSPILFDGYPRDEEQAKTAEEIFTLYSVAALHIVHLQTDESVVIERMMKRGRNDDTQEIIAERLRQYKAVTMPLVAYYNNRPNTRVHTIDGAGDIETVQQAIRIALGI